MSVSVRTRRFSVEEYYRMVRAGILKEDDRVELVDGEIIEMAPMGPRHAFCVDRFNQRLVEALGSLAVVRVQGPISLGPHSEPQPDLALSRPPLTRYTESHPGPDDLFLVIEVADTSVEDDRARKIPLYARAGIREAWLVNLPAETIELYRSPTREGYRDTRALGRGQALAPEAFPEVTFAVDDLFG